MNNRIFKIGLPTLFVAVLIVVFGGRVWDFAKCSLAPLSCTSELYRVVDNRAAQMESDLVQTLDSVQARLAGAREKNARAIEATEKILVETGTKLRLDEHQLSMLKEHRTRADAAAKQMGQAGDRKAVTALVQAIKNDDVQIAAYTKSVASITASYKSIETQLRTMRQDKNDLEAQSAAILAKYEAAKVQQNMTDAQSTLSLTNYKQDMEAALALANEAEARAEAKQDVAKIAEDAKPMDVEAIISGASADPMVDAYMSPVTQTVPAISTTAEISQTMEVTPTSR